MSLSLPKLTELADQIGNSNGSVIMLDDNACFSCDGGANRIGFVKKVGSMGMLAIDASHTFAIGRSSGGTIDSSNTFTNQFTMDASGNIVGVGSFTSAARPDLIGFLSFAPFPAAQNTAVGCPLQQ